MCRQPRHGTVRAVSTALRRSRRYRSRPPTLRRSREHFALDDEEKEQSPTRGAMAAVELYELLLAAALAAARWLAPGSLVGLLEHLLPRWTPRARSPLPLCSCALPRVLVSPQANGSRQGASTRLQFLREVNLPVHGTRPTTARLRLRHHTCIYSLPHALTAHQPVCASQGPMGQTPMAAQTELNMVALVHHAL